MPIVSMAFQYVLEAWLKIHSKFSQHRPPVRCLVNI